MNRLAKVEAEKRRRLQAGASAIVTEAPEPHEWIDSEVTIEDPHLVDSDVIIPFKLWKEQVRLLTALHTIKQIITLKARQLGASWLIIAYGVWLCIFHRNVTVLVLSKDKDSAEEIIRRARGIFRRLRNKPVTEGKENRTAITFSNGSRFKCFAATKNAGTSYTGTLVIVDEADKMEYGLDLYTSIRPTIADGGRIAIIFTAFGEDGLGRRLWKLIDDEREKGNESQIQQIFIPWYARPGRTNEWYETEAKSAVSMAHHRQEYPATPEEALGFTDLDSRLIREPEQWNVLGINPNEVNQQLPCVMAIDAGVSSDLFVTASACWHPTKNIPVIRDIKTWTPALTESGKVDFREAQDWIAAYIKTHRVKRLVYDPYQMVSFGQELRGIVDAQEFPQQQKRTSADTSFRNRIVQSQLAHCGQEVLSLHVQNANIELSRQDEKRLRIVKRHKDKKIDLVIAASMAVWELTTEFAFNMSVGAVKSSRPMEGLNPMKSNTAFRGMPTLLYKKVRSRYE